MYPTHQSKDKFVLFLKIFFPILIYQLANYSASFVDTTMTGQYNTIDLAGVTMATSLWNPFFYLLNWYCFSSSSYHWTSFGSRKTEESSF